MLVLFRRRRFRRCVLLHLLLCVLLDDHAAAVSIRERVVRMYDGNGYGCCCCCCFYCRRVFVIIFLIYVPLNHNIETRQNYRRETVNPEDV